jgi:NADPH:quinone reductase
MSHPSVAQSVATEVRGTAATMTSRGEFVLRQHDFRAPAAGEVRVKIEGCGVCASNLPLWEGKPWFEYPLEPGAPGHEAWGRIDALGSGVTEPSLGARVAILSSHGFAEYDFAASGELVTLPAAFDSIPFPAEPLGCAVNIFKRAQIIPGQTVAIVGVGFLGTLLTQLAAAVGAQLFAISRRRSSLGLAEEFGATATITTTEAADAVRQLTHGRGCECVIEAVGTQESLDLASELTSERGRLVIAGYHQDGPRQVNMQSWNWRGLDVVNAHERDPQVYVAGMREAVAAVQSGVLNPSPLYTHKFKLHELPQAFEAVASCDEGFVKALVTI